jgi:hypothetical protein
MCDEPTLPNGGSPLKRKFYWKDIEVPQEVLIALKTPYRGQVFGKDHTKVMSMFHDIPTLIPTIDGISKCKGTVFSKLVLKVDSTCNTQLGYHAINAGKLFQKVLDNAWVDDEVCIIPHDPWLRNLLLVCIIMYVMYMSFVYKSAF